MTLALDADPLATVFCHLADLFRALATVFFDLATVFYGLASVSFDVATVFVDLAAVFCDLTAMFFDLTVVFHRLVVVFHEVETPSQSVPAGRRAQSARTAVTRMRRANADPAPSHSIVSPRSVTIQRESSSGPRSESSASVRVRGVYVQRPALRP